MKAGFKSIYNELTRNNFCFSGNELQIGDEILEPLNQLKGHLNSNQIQALTWDMAPLDEFKVFIFLDMPALDDPVFLFARKNNIPSLLVIAESPIVHKPNSNTKRFKEFTQVLSYNDTHVDEHHAIKLNYSFDFSRPPTNSSKNKFCCTIASNKTLNHPLSLYGEREKAIRWFEINHPDKFDLYGIGWAEPGYFHNNKLLRVFNRSMFCRKNLKKAYSSYMGSVGKKYDTYKNYKFCICYENTKNIPGYITEKIFDAFMAGCVPIYLGSNSISKHIWPSCFIDMKNFATYEELYRYMNEIDEFEYNEFQKTITSFLSSDDVMPYSIDYYKSTLGSSIIKALSEK